MKISFFHRQKVAPNAPDVPRVSPGFRRRYHWLLQLKCRGQQICAQATDELPERLSIGQAPDNDWVIAEDVHNCRPYQVVLHLKSHDLQITSCSNTKFNVCGKPLTKSSLHRGDRVTFGDCELQVQKLPNAADSSTSHRLEIQNGPRALEIITLDQPLLKIGSAADNDLIFASDVVSRHHAEIRLDPRGEAWIKDCGSINGTYINGSRLSRQERMLMDSDQISIAFFDLLFWDRQKPHTRSRLSQKIFIMTLTIAIILLSFYGVYSLKPQAHKLLILTDHYIKTEQFDRASATLKRLPESPGYKNFESLHRTYLKRLYHYRKTLNVWNKVKSNLKNAQWSQAIEGFGRLDLNNRAMWDWDDSNVDQRLEFCRQIKRQLDIYFGLRAVLQDMSAPPEIQQRALQKIQSSYTAPAPGAPENPAWRHPLNRQIATLIGELKNNCQIWRQTQAALAKLPDLDINFSGLIAQLEPWQKLCTGSVRLGICDIIEVLKDMDEDAQSIQKNQQALTALNLAAIDRQVTFIPPEECEISPHLVTKRQFLVERQHNLLLIADTLSYFKSNNPHWLQTPELLKVFCARDTLSRAFNFSCLQHPMPDFRKGTIADQYDLKFGINYFYRIIRQTLQLSTNLYPRAAEFPNFRVPQCVQVKAYFQRARELDLWLNHPDHRWIKQQEILKLQKWCDSVLQYQKNLLQNLHQIAAAKRGTGAGLAAQVAVFYFSPAGTISVTELKKFAADWQRYQRQLKTLLKPDTPLSALPSRELRQKLQHWGLPGEPVTNRLWSNLEP